MAVIHTTLGTSTPASAPTLELSPLRRRARGLSIEGAVGVNLGARNVAARSRPLTPSVSAVQQWSVEAIGGRVRTITPSTQKNVSMLLIAVDRRARGITPDISFGKSVEMPTTSRRGRTITPFVTTPAANTFDAQTAAGRVRTITPSLLYGRTLRANPLRRRARAGQISLLPAVELDLSPASRRARTLSVRAPVLAAAVAGPLLGGFRILSVDWMTPTAIRVRFATSYGTSYRYQLYAGRCLIGVTPTTANRTVVGLLLPSTYPPPIQMIAVDPGDAFTDYGSILPPRPYNRAVISFAASGFPPDTKFVDVTGSTAPGGAVDDDNLIARQEYDGDRTYNVISEPLGGVGLWSFEAFGRDDKLAAGNKGDTLELSTTIKAHPPDVVADDYGLRLTGTVVSQSLSVDFTYPDL